jgi:hypothetical protein
MKALFARVLVMVVAQASCASHETKTSAAAIDAGVVSITSGGASATCRPTCTTATDCGLPGDPLYDPSHFACQAGLCQWLGCKAASECSAEAHGGNFLCQKAAGAPAPSCVPACQRPADCVPRGNTNPLSDERHFACTAGACVWRGCASAADCSAALHTAKVACEALPGAPAPTCVPTCTVPSDCVMAGRGALGDASHFACQAGTCQWLGCKSTAECVQALQSSKYVCE